MTLAVRETNTLQLAAQATQLLGFGEMLINSGMLPSTIRKPEGAVALMVKGMELGLPPMAAINGISIIQGKPTVSPQLMLSLINRSGQLEDLDIQTGPDGAAVTMKRKGRTPHTAKFGPAEAKAMQLDGKDNYKKQPAVMYQWRAVAACARVVFPDVIDGLYTPEEMGADVQVNEDGEMTVQATVQQEMKADPDVLRQWQAKLDKLVHGAKTRTAAPHDEVDRIMADAQGADVAGLKAACDAVTALGKAHPLKPVEDVIDAEVTETVETFGKDLAAQYHKHLGAMLKGTEYTTKSFISEALGREIEHLADVPKADKATLDAFIKDYKATMEESA